MAGKSGGEGHARNADIGRTPHFEEAIDGLVSELRAQDGAVRARSAQIHAGFQQNVSVRIARVRGKEVVHAGGEVDFVSLLRLLQRGQNRGEVIVCVIRRVRTEGQHVERAAGNRMRRRDLVRRAVRIVEPGQLLLGQGTAGGSQREQNHRVQPDGPCHKTRFFQPQEN